MNLDYISGFFDADGSITLCHMDSSPYRTIKIDFTNVEICILKEIQNFLQQNYNIKTNISVKPPKKESHQTSYALSATYRAAFDLCTLLKSKHPKKLHRINTILKYYDRVTKRNGKYSEKEQQRKLAFERLFFWTGFHQ